ncbi:hypothetical protein N7486_010496 [Penicillium sp. IBT 16267x]|nr:hypothetical protein N7486_010496 [Penicillium sp. IBT 16267x]
MANVTFVPLSSYNWNVSHFKTLPWNPTVYCLTASFLAVALWLSLDLTVQIFITFKKYNSLYFWSILIASWGVAVEAVGFVLDLFVPGINPILTWVLLKIGWICNTTGFSIVLYSRLHFVVHSRRTLRVILAIIIFDAFLFHTPLSVLLLGTATGHDSWNSIIPPFEYFQACGFLIQETMLGGIYIIQTAQFLRPGYSTELHRPVRRLIAVQVGVVLLDIAFIVLDCVGYFTIKAILHPFIYGFKLKIEFAVLNLLVGLVRQDDSHWVGFIAAVRASSKPSRRCSFAIPSFLGRRRANVQSQAIMAKESPIGNLTNSARPIAQATGSVQEEEWIDDLEGRYIGRFGLDGQP